MGNKLNETEEKKTIFLFTFSVKRQVLVLKNKVNPNTD